MDVLTVVFRCVCGAIILYASLRFLKWLFNIAIVGDYEYLELISHVEWKSGREIRAEMIQKKHGRISGPAFYAAMARLEDQNLIEGKYADKVVCGVDIRERQYKKKPGGTRKQHELHLQGTKRPGDVPVIA